MKLFKKVLAVALAAMLALTVFTACDGGDTTEVPSDNTAAAYIQELNTTAQSNGMNNVLDYSADLSNVTRDKLNVWLRNKNGEKDVDTDDKLNDQFEAIDKKCKAERKYESIAYIVSQGDSKPVYKDLFASKDLYESADKVAIIRIKNESDNGGDGKTYTMIELYRKIV